MGLAWSSIAAVSMAPLQDLLNLGKEARMNVPGRADGSWAWRCTNEMLSDSAFEWLRDLTKSSNRFTNPGKAQSVSQPETNFLSGGKLKPGTASVGAGT
jgi:4-alpha-glucanotransferase